ncbi:MAG: hypothetical protein JW827_07605 [Spirochaetes bacterium]|nr:hypothetical protein [Spirochaetota bacterium]
MELKVKQILSLLIIFSILLLISCAPGNVRFDAKPAGFWAGLWHGFISLFTFIISLFSDKVTVYETANTGGWYNFGFILGISIFYGGSCKSRWKPKCKKKSSEEKEWEEIATRVEDKVRKGIKNWLDESGKKKKSQKEKEWKEIGKKIENKIKRELRNWAEK